MSDHASSAPEAEEPSSAAPITLLSGSAVSINRLFKPARPEMLNTSQANDTTPPGPRGRRLGHHCWPDEPQPISPARRQNGHGFRYGSAIRRSRSRADMTAAATLQNVALRGLGPHAREQLGQAPASGGCSATQPPPQSTRPEQPQLQRDCEPHMRRRNLGPRPCASARKVISLR
jgi:hypothetical protein